MANAPDNGESVDDYLAALDESVRDDAQVLVDVMTRISGSKPVMWNSRTLGFDQYHYKYASGREGDCHVLGFHPRKGKITIYLMDGTVRYAEQLERLGRHTTSTACLYLKRLSDIDLPVLEQILTESYAYVKSMDGHMHRAQQ